MHLTEQNVPDTYAGELARRADISILPFESQWPEIDPSVFVASGARIIGDVVIGENSSVWFNVVIRGDVHSIRIGKRTNIQDLTMCHVTNRRYSLTIGDDVTIGHSAVLHGAVIEDGVLVGMGAVILDDARIGKGAIVAAGALVPPGMQVEPGTLVAGIPARTIRTLSDEEADAGSQGSRNYLSYVERFRKDIPEW